MAAVYDPCEPWAVLADMQATNGCPDCVGSEPADIALAQLMLTEAIRALFNLTANLFPGRCEHTVQWEGPLPCGDPHCQSCTSDSAITLHGVDPEIVSVSYNGSVLPGTDYRLRDGRFLVPTNNTSWPSHYVVDPNTLDDRFIIIFRTGPETPPQASRAARDLACQMLMYEKTRDACRLSDGTVSLSAGGTTVTVDPAGILAAGIGSVRMLMELYNSLKQRVPSVVYSFDTDPGFHTFT